MAAAAAAANAAMAVVRRALTAIGFEDAEDVQLHARPSQNFAEVVGITSMEDFLEVEPEEAHRMVKAYNTSDSALFEVGYFCQLRIEKFLTWCRDRNNQGLALDPDAINVAQLNEAAKRAAIFKDFDESKTPKIPRFNKDDPQTWFKQFINCMKARPSRVVGITMAYLTRAAT